MWKWEVEDPRGVIVIVHGAGEHHARYEWLAKQWNDHGFDIVMGDLPGQGRTRGKRGHVQSFNAYLDTIEEWIDEARTSELPVFLLGHSMGGLIVIRTLMERGSKQIKGVILSSPCLGLQQQPSKTQEIGIKVIHRVMPTISANAGIKTEHLTRNDEVKEEYLKDELRVTKVSVRWYQELSKAMRTAQRYPEKFPDLPLIVLQGGEDYVVDKFEVRAWFDHLTLTDKYYKEWDGLYHEVFNEPERKDVFRHALGFLNLLLP
ncbi:alpha/beta hydrolase [Bacillus suaedae]|uniref:Alpha/beta hydrolase n=1 Tax=Halalkalibacter suaedae TaxID=2822140 RepID=A0A940WTC6_9BACI|nr:alpha/beta hydrolase [Bacillus suaedae]